ncbi:MAG: HAMP domain-containing histidine kinase [Lachnospiraceae bacterium]|nr:HAMP domain-containing histidine kinase [Lachnospiraceae bacterium]
MGKNKKNKNENNIEVIDAMANEIKETADQNIESGNKQDEDQHPEDQQTKDQRAENQQAEDQIKADRQQEKETKTADRKATDRKAVDQKTADRQGISGKKTTRGRCIGFGFLTLLFVMIALGISIFILKNSVIIDGVRKSSDMIAINPFEKEAQSFRDTADFQSVFYTNVSDLSYRLALATQLESGGKFDGEKKIDVISYYYRRHPNQIPEKYKDVKIEYKLADLLAWCDEDSLSWRNISAADWAEKYGNNSGNTDEAAKQTYCLINETYLPADGVSLYERYYPDGMESIFANSIVERGEAEIVYDENGEPIEEYPGDFQENEDNYVYTNNGAFHVGEYYEGIPSLAQILSDDMQDLRSNTEQYERYADWLTEETNLKYVLLTPSGMIQKSNLRLPDYFMKQDASVRKAKLAKAFTSKKTYVAYTYGQAALQHGDLDNRENTMLASIRRNGYNFADGSMLYVCVLDEGANDDVLGRYLTDDIYGKADAGYRQVAGTMTGYIPMLICLGFAALICFACFMIFVPKYEKEQVQGFHKVPTLIAAALLTLLAGAVFAVPFMLKDGYTQFELLHNRATVFELICSTVFVCGLIDMIIFLYAWYSLILRIKSRTLLSNSLFAWLFGPQKGLLIKGLRLIGKAISWIVFLFATVLESIAGFFQKQKSMILRTWVPYIGFLFINFLVLGFTGMHAIGVFFLILLVQIPVGVLIYLKEKGRTAIADGVGKIVEGDLDYQIDAQKLFDGNKELALQVNMIGDTVRGAVEQSMQDERMKTELITNVSHDIKTPLTSIINYVDLLKRENLPEGPAQEYIKVLEEKSQRLKVLIVDLVEASKISSGNITLNMEDLDIREMVSQSLGEFEDRIEAAGLSVIYEKPEVKMSVHADPARLWRVLENLMGNVCKYAMPGSRVYVELASENAKDVTLPVPIGAQADDTGMKSAGMIALTIKNISASPLNISTKELTERFVRGDQARSSEGSGLGLSIAKDLTTLMGGDLQIILDGDLFKACVTMPAGADQN